MSEPIYLLTILMPLATIFLVFYVRARAAVQKARLLSENEAAYRLIAERAVAAQEHNAAVLAELKTRIIAIEKVLKEVE